ncbi:MAG: hypothetical protein IT271_03690, partial [Chitinophagales bacterium]|nr:hypothetical protein [Chitinophagales bacterium]
NILKTKKIQVATIITTIDGIINSTKTTSIEIEKINETLIEEIRFEFVKAARKKESLDGKHLFTIDEYLETFVNEGFKVQQLYKDDKDFIESLIEKYETKHYNHLRFLSSKHKAEIQKLRIVHKPFSFVFLISGINKFHIVWETLDTQEATYIWTVDNNTKDLKQALTNTDKIINLINRDGKNEYIKQNEKNFNRVFHDYTDMKNGFKHWKEDIEKIVSPPPPGVVTRAATD